MNRPAIHSVYLAGPWVFLSKEDRAAFMRSARSILSVNALTACFPTGEGTADPELIRRRNMALIASCDAVIADLNPFRGVEPDSGTVFECGYAIGLGKPVAAYASCAPYATRAASYAVERPDALGATHAIEDYQGYRANLMIHRLIAGADIAAAAKAIRAQEPALATPEEALPWVRGEARPAGAICAA